MAKAKKTTKKPVDQRLPHSYYEELVDKRADDAITQFLSTMSKGFMDFRMLTKPLNEKSATALSTSIAPVTAYNENGDISVSIALNEIHYSRHGVVFRYIRTVDDRVTGSYDAKTYVVVNSIIERKFRPHVSDIIKISTECMAEMLEDEFNKVLYKNKLAPTPYELYDDEDY